MINHIVTDLIEASRRRIEAAALRSIEDVRERSRSLVGLSPEVAAGHRELKSFLHASLYRHERVLAMNRQAGQLLTALFERFMNDIHLLPAEHAGHARAGERRLGEAGRARAVADYLAGMTDRYAIATYRRLVDPRLDW
jgi:dGTPase